MTHKSTFRGFPSGAGQLRCSCGWETPQIDESYRFLLGHHVPTLDSLFAEHLKELAIENATKAPEAERAVSAVQKAAKKFSRR